MSGPATARSPALGRVLALLRKNGEEPFAFAPGAADALDAIVRDVVAAPGAGPALYELIKLAIVLERQHESPTAANQLVEAMRRSDDARRVLVSVEEASKEVRERFERFTAQVTEKIAPLQDAPSPANSLKVASLRPASAVDLDRRRATSRIPKPRA